jgi:hypothetical protein
MNLSIKAICMFLDLQEIVTPITSKIFRPIIAEVERHGQEFLLFPPVESTTWVEWLVKSPERHNFDYPHYLFFMIQEAGKNGLVLRLVARLGAGFGLGFGGRPKTLNWEAYKELFRTGQISNIDVEDEVFYTDVILRHLAWFGRKREINPEVIAKRIISWAGKLYMKQVEFMSKEE